MFYPAYVHKDPGSAYGVTLPDFPGCFTAADSLQELPRQVQEAVELYVDGEDLSIPVPTTPDDWAGDDRFQGGYWMLIDIDLDLIMHENELATAHVLAWQAWRDECRRQSFIAREADKKESWIQRLIEQDLKDIEGWE